MELFIHSTVIPLPAVGGIAGQLTHSACRVIMLSTFCERVGHMLSITEVK